MAGKKAIFVSIDGMTDQLGQSQVLPYLVGLSREGFSVEICSCEKKENFKKNAAIIQSIVDENKITWSFCFYENKVPLLSQRSNYKRLKALVLKRIEANSRNVILHCRSYLPGLIGLYFKQKFHIPYIFDMRGFWADERIDGGIWKLSNPIHRQLYNFFKKKEREMFLNAAAIVSLTNNGKKEILSWDLGQLSDITVIPCCADLDHFTLSGVACKKAIELNKVEGEFYLGYLGALGTWYMLGEMLDFFNVLLKKYPHAKFIFITNDDENKIKRSALEKNIDPAKIIVVPASRNEVPSLIRYLDLSIFFIKPLYSKKGSSPTKLAELLACGVPVVGNVGVGDIDTLLSNGEIGYCVNAFTEGQYKLAVEAIDKIRAIPNAQLRGISEKEFSLDKGLESYKSIYLKLLQ